MGCMFQLAHFSIGDWKDISIAHVIIIIKSEVSTFPLLSYFSLVVCLRCLLHHILSLIAYTFRESGNLFSLLLCNLWWVQIIGYVCIADRTRLFVQYTISLSSLCRITWRHWTYKMPVRYILSSVWVRLSTFSQLSIIQSIIQYVGLYVFSLPTPLVMIERIYILCPIIIIKSEVWTITHYLELGHETMVCAVCLSIFLWTSIIQQQSKGTTKDTMTMIHRIF